MHALLTRLTKIFFVATFVLSTASIVSAEELNTENFSGTINTTLTSGFTIRASERDCTVNFGYQHDSAITGWDTVYSSNGAGCSGYLTDAYGNTSTEYINIAGANPNTDDGNLNFDNGDVVNASQSFYTEIIGDTNGVGINLSLTGSYNPVDDINAPNFKKLKPEALHSQEQDLSLLNAYMTTELDLGDNYVDLTIGRSVVSWGEATFIPIVANGLVTGALDVTKLRSPSSSIKEALKPIEQVVFSTSVEGVGIEAYYQFQSDMVEVDVAGSFFGSEIVGAGEAGIIAGGAFQDEAATPVCSAESSKYADTATNCSDAIAALTRIKNGSETADSYLDAAFDLAGSAGTASAIATGFAATKSFGSENLANNSLAAGTTGLPAGLTYGNLTTKTSGGYAFYQNSTAGFMAAMVAAGSHTVRPTERIGGVQIMVADDGKFKEARDDGQYGIKFSNYIDVAGGIDFSVYYSKYHSKVPYLRIKGHKGLFAGDLYGLFNTAIYDSLDNGAPALAAFKSGGAYNGAFTTNKFGQNIIAGIREIGYSSAICSAALGKAMASAYSGGATGTKYTTTAQERASWNSTYMSTQITGQKSKTHDPNKCSGFADGANVNTSDLRYHAAFALAGGSSSASKAGSIKDAHLGILGTGAFIGAAITPMNYFEYDFIFPEDNQIFGSSFSTVVDGTVVQGEVSFRPDFPLSTPAGSQVNQLADASGATQTLNWVAFAQLDGLGESLVAAGDATGDGLQLKLALQVLGAAGATAGGNTTAYTTALRDFKRSSLPSISTATVIAGDYYSTPFIEYDVWSADIGTTTAFNASHPITLGLGADSVVFLTELGMVHIPDLDNTNGYVARGGSSQSGDSPDKCKGAFGASNVYTTTKSVDAIGAAQVDGLFGNGGYCEDNPGAGSTALSYRLIGSATYNNFANSQWSVAPNFAWAHDPSGYGPSSLGGFVEGKMSLALGMRASKGAVSASLSYVNQLGDAESNLSRDKDTLSASVSYAF
jgi:hypothetical protein